ncbi:hypothetical protein QQP08_001302 [Theobroma cacao]|nr:hypothetical protein QQP08_001302 [Theobroma cacao]
MDLKLVTLYYMAIDFAKTRAPAEMPRSLKPREFLNFMQRVDKPMYASLEIKRCFVQGLEVIQKGLPT